MTHDSFPPVGQADSSSRRSLGFLSVLLVLSALGLTSCSLFESKKDKDDKPPKRQEHNYRDPVEQKVFYDGFWER